MDPALHLDTGLPEHPLESGLCLRHRVPRGHVSHRGLGREPGGRGAVARPGRYRQRPHAHGAQGLGDGGVPPAPVRGGDRAVRDL